MIELSSVVLVVDDTDFHRNNATDILKRLGYSKIKTAADGKAALRELEQAEKEGKPVGFVLCDWEMPVMDGMELLGYVRISPKWRDLPFVMVTSEMNTGNILKAVAAGVTDYVVKPLTRDLLEKKIKDINQRGSRR